MEAQLFHADGGTDMKKLIVAFRNFANAPKIDEFPQKSKPHTHKRLTGNRPDTPSSCFLSLEVAGSKPCSNTNYSV